MMKNSRHSLIIWNSELQLLRQKTLLARGRSPLDSRLPPSPSGYGATGRGNDALYVAMGFK